MTAFCCGCHGAFHDEKDASGNWIRHPSDAVLGGAGTEYAGYTTYDPVVPVARASLSTVKSTVSGSGGDGDMVMCLSCHRAHGSPYPDMLRWDNDNMVAGGGGTGGCFTCHTEKD
jgi:predicted CXXCH cytochrome family protein